MLEVFTQLANWLVWDLLHLDPSKHTSQALHFFIEDTSKIIVLVLVMIYAIGILRASLNLDLVRNKLQGKSRLFGYVAASLFGAVTPFCSCSSIPMFLGFTAARIPTGVTLAFLITSPLINEVAVVLLGAMLGWEFTLIYIVSGLIIGVLGGFVFDALRCENHLQPLAVQARNSVTPTDETSVNNQSTTQVDSNARPTSQTLSLRARHDFAWQETREIFSRIWKWILVGVGAGALLHGFVPQEWIATHLGDGSWWSVPSAVILGIPLYSNASGMIPVVESLLAKGLPAGTALALMMSTVGASFPEFILLKQVLKPRLLLWLFLYFLAAFTISGWLINLIF